MKAGTKSRASLPVAQTPTPMYSITFGHHVKERGVLFAIGETRLVFRPEDAEDIAANLLEQARLARGLVDPRGASLARDARLRRGKG